MPQLSPPSLVDKPGRRPEHGAAPAPQPAHVSSGGIAAQLRRAILDGVYAYDERLPPERQLAIDFSAARGTVRAALRRLEAMNLIARRVGSGTYVRYRDASDRRDIAEITSPLELIDVRLGIEPQIVRLAIGNATARDLERIHAALKRVEASVDDTEYFTLTDGEFHLALAECTHSPLMVWLYRHINDVRGHKQWSAMKDQVLTSERISRYNLQHHALFTAISTRDVDGAIRVITEHLETTRRDLLGVRATG